MNSKSSNIKITIHYLFIKQLYFPSLPFYFSFLAHFSFCSPLFFFSSSLSIWYRRRLQSRRRQGCRNRSIWIPSSRPCRPQVSFSKPGLLQLQQHNRPCSHGKSTVLRQWTPCGYHGHRCPLEITPEAS
jgi:hypothetical protein